MALPFGKLVYWT